MKPLVLTDIFFLSGHHGTRLRSARQTLPSSRLHPANHANPSNLAAASGSRRARHGGHRRNLGSQAGVEILKRGGNAVDAAVAVAFALAVVEPAAGNIGGGGFMLVRLADGKTNFFDYREVAPGKATRNMYVKDGKLIPDASTLGYRSVAVPGTVAGLELALKTHGTMKLADVMAPAIRLAKEGFPVTEKLVTRIRGRKIGPAAIRRQQTHFSAIERPSLIRLAIFFASRNWRPLCSASPKTARQIFTAAKPRA